MVERKINLVRDINPRRKPTGGRNRTRGATEDATIILDEVAAAADKAVVADVAAVNAGAETIATEATRTTAKTVGATSPAIATGKRATSSRNAQRRAKNVDSVERWAICR